MTKDDIERLEKYVNKETERYIKLYQEEKIGLYFLSCRLAEVKSVLKITQSVLIVSSKE